MSSTLLLPPRAQLCNRSCSNKTHTRRGASGNGKPFVRAFHRGAEHRGARSLPLCTRISTCGCVMMTARAGGCVIAAVVVLATCDPVRGFSLAPGQRHGLLPGSRTPGCRSRAACRHGRTSRPLFMRHETRRPAGLKMTAAAWQEGDAAAAARLYTKQYTEAPAASGWRYGLGREPVQTYWTTT
jgi:hypothetical protein